MFRKLFQKGDGSKLLNSGIKGLDKVFFTKEEKSAIPPGIADAYADYVAKQLGSNTIESKVRRNIATMINGLWFFYGLSYAVLTFFDKDHIADKLYRFLSEDLTTSNLLVLTFYFSSHLLAKAGIASVLPLTKKRKS